MNSALPRTRQQLDDKAKEVYFKANIEGKNNNIKEIDDAINFYTERQQEEEDADQIRKTQDIIDGLTKKKHIFELSIDLATKSREIREIEEGI
ncbi:MAG: hypothetical protein J5548_07605 [Prevotella sp.]|nr:hypothetical protein [Prevotella sp.]